MAVRSPSTSALFRGKLRGVGPRTRLADALSSSFRIQGERGDQVRRGQEIGLSGGTGRATGPHLHVAVRWEGTYLDPARLLQLRLRKSSQQ